jgi:hypothetical protein
MKTMRKKIMRKMIEIMMRKRKEEMRMDMKGMMKRMRRKGGGIVEENIIEKATGKFNRKLELNNINLRKNSRHKSKTKHHKSSKGSEKYRKNITNE